MKFKTRLKLIALFLSFNSILIYRAFAMEDANENITINNNTPEGSESSGKKDENIKYDTSKISTHKEKASGSNSNISITNELTKDESNISIKNNIDKKSIMNLINKVPGDLFDLYSRNYNETGFSILRYDGNLEPVDIYLDEENKAKGFYVLTGFAEYCKKRKTLKSTSETLLNGPEICYIEGYDSEKSLFDTRNKDPRKKYINEKLNQLEEDMQKKLNESKAQSKDKKEQKEQYIYRFLETRDYLKRNLVKMDFFNYLKKNELEFKVNLANYIIGLVKKIGIEKFSSNNYIYGSVNRKGEKYFKEINNCSEVFFKHLQNLPVFLEFKIYEEYFNRKHNIEKFNGNIENINKDIITKYEAIKNDKFKKGYLDNSEKFDAVEKLTLDLKEILSGNINNKETTEKFVDVVTDLIYCLFFKLFDRLNILPYPVSDEDYKSLFKEQSKEFVEELLTYASHYFIYTDEKVLYDVLEEAIENYTDEKVLYDVLFLEEASKNFTIKNTPKVSESSDRKDEKNKVENNSKDKYEEIKNNISNISICGPAPIKNIKDDFSKIPIHKEVEKEVDTAKIFAKPNEENSDKKGEEKELDSNFKISINKKEYEDDKKIFADTPKFFADFADNEGEGAAPIIKEKGHNEHVIFDDRHHYTYIDIAEDDETTESKYKKRVAPEDLLKVSMVPIKYKNNKMQEKIFCSIKTFVYYFFNVWLKIYNEVFGFSTLRKKETLDPIAINFNFKENFLPSEIFPNESVRKEFLDYKNNFGVTSFENKWYFNSINSKDNYNYIFLAANAKPLGLFSPSCEEREKLRVPAHKFLDELKKDKYLDNEKKARLKGQILFYLIKLNFLRMLTIEYPVKGDMTSVVKTIESYIESLVKQVGIDKFFDKDSICNKVKNKKIQYFSYINEHLNGIDFKIENCNISNFIEKSDQNILELEEKIKLLERREAEFEKKINEAEKEKNKLETAKLAAKALAEKLKGKKQKEQNKKMNEIGQNINKLEKEIRKMLNIKKINKDEKEAKTRKLILLKQKDKKNKGLLNFDEFINSIDYKAYEGCLNKKRNMKNDENFDAIKELNLKLEKILENEIKDKGKANFFVDIVIDLIYCMFFKIFDGILWISFKDKNLDMFGLVKKIFEKYKYLKNNSKIKAKDYKKFKEHYEDIFNNSCFNLLHLDDETISEFCEKK